MASRSASSMPMSMSMVRSAMFLFPFGYSNGYSDIRTTSRQPRRGEHRGRSRSTTRPDRWPGCRVVDLTDLRGALCARILADLGADVIRVESARSHPTRSAARVSQREQAQRRARPRDRRGALASTRCWPAPTCSSRTSTAASAPASGSTPTRSPRATRTSCTSRSPTSGSTGPRADWHLEAAAGARGVGRAVGVGLPAPPAVHRAGPPRARLRVGVRRDRRGRRGARPRARTATRPARRGERAGGRARRHDPVVDRDAGLHVDQPAAAGRRPPQRRRRVLGAPGRRRMGARRGRLAEAVGRLQDADAGPRRSSRPRSGRTPGSGS